MAYISECQIVDAQQLYIRQFYGHVCLSDEELIKDFVKLHKAKKVTRNQVRNGQNEIPNKSRL